MRVWKNRKQKYRPMRLVNINDYVIPPASGSAELDLVNLIVHCLPVQVLIRRVSSPQQGKIVLVPVASPFAPAYAPAVSFSAFDCDNPILEASSSTEPRLPIAHPPPAPDYASPTRRLCRDGEGPPSPRLRKSRKRNATRKASNSTSLYHGALERRYQPLSSSSASISCPRNWPSWTRSGRRRNRSTTSRRSYLPQT